ncbi:MAG: DUF2147 domain-containing protein [Sideroxydans sp.]|nr:DUF2147 domain-containing protein [Sideroxydans sp.]
MKRVLFIFLSLLFTASSSAQSLLTGLWKTVDDSTGIDKGLVRITQTNGALFGIVEQIFEVNKRNGHCDKCSDERRDRSVLGMTILRNVKPSEDGLLWEGGDILDPENGKVYRVRLKLLEGGNKMEVRGYIGPFYRNQQWLRIE